MRNILKTVYTVFHIYSFSCKGGGFEKKLVNMQVIVTLQEGGAEEILDGWFGVQ